MARNSSEKMRVREAIVVEGRDDTDAVKKACEAAIIETHGFGIAKETWNLIAKAYEEKGIIVFTDPDHAGETIRKKITEKFPGAKQAFLDRRDAEKDGDIGIENAAPEAIREALGKAKATVRADGEGGPGYTNEDMKAWGLTGTPEAAERRAALGKALGIGSANAKSFLKRLNGFDIERVDIEAALKAVGGGRNGDCE